MVIEFCKCKKGKYRWRDVANVNGKIIKVDEEAELDQNKETFDIDPIIEKIARNENVSVDEVMLATFEKNFPNSVIESCWKDKELGGYCTVCGKDI